MQDAYILGRILGDPRTTLSRVPAALRVYEAVRLPFARTVVRDAHTAGRMYEFNGGPGLYDGVDADEADTRARLAELERAIVEIWEWQWKTPAEAQWAEVERQLEGLFRADKKEMLLTPKDVREKLWWWKVCPIM